MEKPYAVIYFVEQSLYSEIPSNWLLNDNESTGGITKCKWPPSFIKNLNFYSKSRLTPSDNWLTYDVKIIRYCASEKPLGKGYRSKRPSAIATAASSGKTSGTDHISSDEENNMTVKS
ncbi:hypothetical protein PV328_012315, partial [Microctonus aethiopoides]